MPKLFAVYLGGQAERSNIELHDVVFVVGNVIEDTYGQLMDKWFGIPDGLHLDAWSVLDVIDGHRISLTKQKPASEEKLYFINLGAYIQGEFTEAHACTFLVAKDKAEIKQRAKAKLLLTLKPHTDDLYEVDDCLHLSEIDGYYIQLEKTDQPDNFSPVCSYHIIPKDLLAAYKKRLQETA